MSAQQHANLDKEDLEFYLETKKSIDNILDQKIISLTKHHHPSEIEVKKLTEECEKQYFENMTKRIENDVALHTHTIVLVIEELKESNPLLYKKFNNISKLTESGELNKMIADCKSIKDFKNFTKNLLTLSEDDKNEIYKIGSKWFESDCFDKALSCFYFLSVIEPTNVTYWISRGMAQQNLGKYIDAINSYYRVISLAPEYFLSYLQIIECTILNEQLDIAKQLLENIMKEVDPKEYSNNQTYVSKINDFKKILL